MTLCSVVLTQLHWTLGLEENKPSCSDRQLTVSNLTLRGAGNNTAAG